MNKQQLAEILQSCLLFNDGLSLEEIKPLMDSPENALIGVKLCEYLEEITKRRYLSSSSSSSSSLCLI